MINVQIAGNHLARFYVCFLVEIYINFIHVLCRLNIYNIFCTIWDRYTFYDKKMTHKGADIFLPVLMTSNATDWPSFSILRNHSDNIVLTCVWSLIIDTVLLTNNLCLMTQSLFLFTSRYECYTNRLHYSPYKIYNKYNPKSKVKEKKKRNSCIEINIIAFNL